MSDKRCAANGGTPFLNTGDGFSTFRPSGLRVWPFSCEKTLKSKEIISRVGKQKKKGGKDEKFPSKRGQVPPLQPLMEKTFRRKHIIIRFKKHMFGNHCKRARAKPEFDKKKFFKNWSNRDCSHKKVLPMKFVACANKLKFLKRNSPLILHSTKARRSFQTNKFSDDYKRNA